ncbi:MAG: glycoside hydrolase family 2 TIM barrel-domain containing protein [Mangrovibacterium sp.]
MINKLLVSYLLAVLIMLSGVSAIGQRAGREQFNLNKGWTIYPAYNVNRDVEKQKVDLPHTWNTADVFNGPNYYRGTMVYQRKLEIDSDFSGKRLFLYFEGANSVATVLVNGKLAGEHFGGYTAFCYEITDLVEAGKNADLSVWVSNAYRTDVIPLSGDFNCYGGLHRSVHLLVTNKNCISPLDYASSGVYIRPVTVSYSKADFVVNTKLSLNRPQQNLKLSTKVFDAGNKLVAENEIPLPLGGVSELSQEFRIEKPVLWNGKQNPYCYRVEVELYDGNELVDGVKESTGFRYFSVDAEQGFLLNGQYLDLYGFGIHEDVEGKGSAYTPDNYIQDMALVKESGATALRLTHYPHGKTIYDLSDREGIVLWTEIPFVGPGGYTGPGYVASEALHRNTKNMLIEMIRQNFNHPSVFFWGLLNELKFDFDDPLPFVTELNNLAKKEDPSRLTTSASFGEQMEFVSITDAGGWNQYFGWYGGTPEQMGTFMDKMKAQAGGKPLCVTEFGAGASISQHQWPALKPDPSGPFHPEEWQLAYHEGNWRELSTRKYVWAKFVWNFADFGSAIRNEGDRQGINDKGLITYNHQTRKDAFYFYKANWNPEPMLHLVAKRFVSRSNSLTDIKAFTNASEAELWLNGKKIGVQLPDRINTVVWKDIRLFPGENRVEIRAKAGKQTLYDSCTWILTETDKAEQ